MPKFDKDAQVTNRLKFKPLEQFGNLCLGRMNGVAFKESKEPANADKGYEYGGFKIPMLEMEFIEWKENEADPDRFYTHRFTPIVSKKNTGEAIEHDQVVKTYQDMFFQLKHIHDAYTTVPNFVLLGDIPDIDENATPEEKIKQFTVFFKYFETLFNSGKDKKPIFADANNKAWLMVMKLVSDYKSGKFLTFPTFVGEGFIERAYLGDNKKLKTTLEFKPGEGVELVKGRKAMTDDSGPDAENTSGLDAATLEDLNIG